jgi:hypothetical protein
VDSEQGIEVAELRFLARRALQTIPKTKPYFQNEWNVVDFFTLFVQACTLRPPSSLFSCCPYPKLKSAAIVSLNAENVSSSSGSFPPAAHRTLSRIFSSWLSPQTLQSSPTHERFFFVIYSSLLSSQTLQSSPTHKVTRCL